MIYVKDSAWFTSVAPFHKPFFGYRFAKEVLSMGCSVLHKLNYFLTHCYVVVQHSEITVTIVTVSLAWHGRFIS